MKVTEITLRPPPRPSRDIYIYVVPVTIVGTVHVPEDFDDRNIVMVKSNGQTIGDSTVAIGDVQNGKGKLRVTGSMAIYATHIDDAIGLAKGAIVDLVGGIEQVVLNREIEIGAVITQVHPNSGTIKTFFGADD